MEIYVADTSYILHGKKVDGKVFIPSSVLEEIRSFMAKVRLELFDYDVKDPKKKFIKMVIEKAKETGDFKKLSKTDIDVLALALELKAKILTDDFRIQNVAKALGLEFEGTKKIKKALKWKKICPKCGREFEDLNVCPFCLEKLVVKAVKVEKVFKNCS